MERLSRDDISFLLAIGYADVNNENGYVIDSRIIQDLKDKGVIVEMTKEGVVYSYV